MTPTVDSLGGYIASVRSRFIDVDGWFGAQCWDQWSHYATNFLGVPVLTTYADAGGSWPHSGYACNVFHNARSAGLERWFEILPASATPRAGDVAFWDFGSAWYPWSHVATVLEVLPGGRLLRCLTQNPGAVQIADLITNGLIGYLRPRALILGGVDASPTATLTASTKLAAQARLRRRKEDPMHLVILKQQARSDGSAAYAIYKPGVPGSWEEFDNFTARGMYANSLSSQFGQPMEVTLKRWSELQKKYS
ncbi:CHAP domain-containing protein [Leucobacter musarum]|uniref:CHAP domain-containing protein n=1 Tax=Leucobacter musarum TaxID=1930747 RepID=UPI0006A7BC02|nr:CHAP domain-containing protein [Leucobacter musarum]